MSLCSAALRARPHAAHYHRLLNDANRCCVGLIDVCTWAFEMMNRSSSDGWHMTGRIQYTVRPPLDCTASGSTRPNSRPTETATFKVVDENSVVKKIEVIKSLEISIVAIFVSRIKVIVYCFSDIYFSLLPHNYVPTVLKHLRSLL